MNSLPAIYQTRATYSKSRLDELCTHLTALQELKEYPGLTIFGAGSFARLEASQYSDIDMFFLTGGQGSEVTEPRTKQLRIFGKVIEIVDSMKFPSFSNDCQYLAVLSTEEMLATLGSPRDDHENYFTARMLLLLESYCLYGKPVYDEVSKLIVQSYFKDYPSHTQSFQPTFLLNDISRYWKTILLNYENRRILRKDEADYERKSRKHRVKNFKLKYSRMTTCFASIASLGSYRAPVTEDNILELTKLTPQQRLDTIPSRISDTRSEVDEVLDGYAWFLEMTGLQTIDLEERFSDEEKRTEMFEKANKYGDSMYKLLQKIDQCVPNSNLLRYLVI